MKTSNFIYLFMFIALISLNLKCEKEDPDSKTDRTDMHAEFTITPESGTVNTVFTIDPSKSYYTLDGLVSITHTPEKFQWDFDYEGPLDTDWDMETDNNNTFTHKFSEPKTHTVLLRVSEPDALDDADDTYTLEVTVEPAEFDPPVALMTIFPEQGYTNWTTFFIDGSLSWDKEDGMVLQEFLWDKDGDGAYDGDFTNESQFETTFDEPGEYTIKLKVRDSDGMTGETEETIVVHHMGGTPCPDAAFVVDIDGNEYLTAQIGDQCWMDENLKTTTYNDGTPIPEVEEFGQWAQLLTGAYAWYQNEAEWKDHYGALYNGFAVMSSHGLCPEGWHVPTDEEWTALTNFIGGTSMQYANELKSCRQVNSPIGGLCDTEDHPRWDQNNLNYGTDQFGLKLLPGGYRSYMWDFFESLGSYGYWWTSTETTSYSAMFRYLGDGSFKSDDHSMKSGYSVRCIKN